MLAEIGVIFAAVVGSLDAGDALVAPGLFLPRDNIQSSLFQPVL